MVKSSGFDPEDISSILVRPAIFKRRCFNMRENKYVAIKVGGKRMDEHRYVWEKHYGKIPDGYVVHHINEIKYDNRIENLEIMPLPEHSRMHNGLNNWRDNNPEANKERLIKSGKSRRIVGEEGFTWCAIGLHFEKNECFSKNKKRWTGLEASCKECRKLYRNKK